MINTSNAASLSILSAKTGPSEAEATIANAEIGRGRSAYAPQQYSVADLFSTRDRIVEAERSDALRQKSDVLSGREQFDTSGKV